MTWIWNNGFINIPDSKNGQSRRAYPNKDRQGNPRRKRVNGNSPGVYIQDQERALRFKEVSETYARVVERMGL